MHTFYDELLANGKFPTTAGMIDAEVRERQRLSRRVTVTPRVPAMTRFRTPKLLLAPVPFASDRRRLGPIDPQSTR